VAAVVAGPRVAAALRPRSDFESYLDFIRPESVLGWDFGREEPRTFLVSRYDVPGREITYTELSEQEIWGLAFGPPRRSRGGRGRRAT